MRLRLRLLWLVFKGLFSKQLGISDTSTINLRVLPNDVDIRKVSGDRYFALSDLGWVSLLIRWGVFSRVIRAEFAPVALIMTMKAREPLYLLEKFNVESRVIYWDERWFYVEMKFISKGRVKVVCINKGGILKDGKVLEVSKWIPGATEVPSPQKPPVVKKLLELEGAIR